MFAAAASRAQTCSWKQARAALQVLAAIQQSAPQAVKQRAVHLSAQASAAPRACTSAPAKAATCFTCSGLVPHADQAQSSRHAAAHAAPGHRHRWNVTTTRTPSATDCQLHSLPACLARAYATTRAFNAAHTYSTELGASDVQGSSDASSALPNTADVPRSDTTMAQAQTASSGGAPTATDSTQHLVSFPPVAAGAVILGPIRKSAEVRESERTLREIRAAIFDHHLNEENLQTGRKTLAKAIKGPFVSDYYLDKYTDPLATNPEGQRRQQVRPVHAAMLCAR